MYTASSMFSSLRRTQVQWLRAISASVLVFAASDVRATNLVQNGSFETNGGVGQLTTKTTASPWTVGATTDGAPVPFVFIVDGNADSTGFPSSFSPPNILIWGPNTPVGTSDPAHSYPGPGSHPVGPVANGFNGTPDGTYFLGVDGAYANAPVSQTISGLTVGDQYTLSFIYAGAQFTDALGSSTEGWQVTFGSETVSTPILNNASQGFTGWQTFSTTPNHRPSLYSVRAC